MTTPAEYDDELYVRMKPRSGLHGKCTQACPDPIKPSVFYTIRAHVDEKKAGRWNRVPAYAAEEMRNVVEDEYVAGSPLIFDVCTEEEAKALDAKERAEREAEIAKIEPSVETAVDLTTVGKRGGGKAAAARERALAAIAARLGLGDDDEPGDDEEGDLDADGAIEVELDDEPEPEPVKKTRLPRRRAPAKKPAKKK